MPSIITQVAALPFGGGRDPSIQLLAAAMRVKYLLEFTNKAGSPPPYGHAKHMPLPHVVAHDYTRNHAQNIQWGMGESPVIEYSGMRDARVVIRGCSGIEKRTGTDSTGSVMYKRGYEIFKELAKWVQKYEELQHANQTGHLTGYFEHGPERHHLRLHALTEGITYYGEIESFTYRKDSQRYRFSYEYTLTLRVFKAVNLTGENVAVLPADDFTTIVTEAMAYTEKAAAFAEMTDNLTKTVMREVENFGGIMDACDNVSRMLTSLSSAGQTIGETLNYVVMGPTAAVMRVSKEALGVVDSVIQALTFNQTPEVKRAFYDAYKALSDAERDAAIAVGGAMVTASSVTATPGAAGMESVPVEPATSSYLLDQSGDPGVGGHDDPTVEHTVAEGGTIEDMLSFLGWGDATITLIEVVLALNNMIDKTTLGSGKPLGAGDTLVLPVPGDGGPAAVGSTGGLYSRDLLLGADGDLVLSARKTMNASGNSTDIDLWSWGVETVTGSKLIKQAIRNRLLTEAGQNSPFPVYGLPTLVGEKSMATTYGIIAAAITEQLGRDPRVTRVAGVDIVDVGDGYEVDCVAETPYGADLSLTVPLQV